MSNTSTGQRQGQQQGAARQNQQQEAPRQGQRQPPVVQPPAQTLLIPPQQPPNNRNNNEAAVTYTEGSQPHNLFNINAHSQSPQRTQDASTASRRHNQTPPDITRGIRNISPPSLLGLKIIGASRINRTQNEYGIDLSGSEAVSEECKFCGKQIAKPLLNNHSLFCTIQQTTDKQTSKDKEKEKLKGKITTSSSTSSLSKVKSATMTQQFSSVISKKLKAFDPMRQPQFYRSTDEMLRNVTVQDLLREASENTTYDVPAQERMDQLEGRVKEYLQFTRRSGSSELRFTNGLVLQIRNAKNELDKAVKKLNEFAIRRNERKKDKKTQANDPIIQSEKDALIEANKANVWYLRTVELILQTEIGINPDLTRPKLSVVPIKVEETEGDTVVTIERDKMLESTELTLWQIRTDKKLRKKIYCKFKDEVGIDQGGVQADWYTSYFRKATQPESGIFRRHGAEGRLTVWGDDQGSGSARKSPLPAQKRMNPLHRLQDGLPDHELATLLPWWAAGAMLGRILLLENMTVLCHLDFVLWRQLLGQAPCFEDLGVDDQEVAMNLKKMLKDPKFAKDLGMNFTIQVEEEGKDNFEQNVNDGKEKQSSSSSSSSSSKQPTNQIQTFEVPLKVDGANIDVTEQNVIEFIELYAKRKIFGSEKAKKQAAALFQGFREAIPYEYLFSDHTIIPTQPERENEIRDDKKSDAGLYFKELITPTQLTPKELDEIICGRIEIDVAEWEAKTRYKGLESQVKLQKIQFWKIVREMTSEQRMNLLQFATGIRTVPVGGFDRLQKKDSPIFLIEWVACTEQNSQDEPNEENQLKRESKKNYEARIDKYIEILQQDITKREKAVSAIESKKAKKTEDKTKIDANKKIIGLLQADIKDCEEEKKEHIAEIQDRLSVGFHRLYEQRARLSQNLATIADPRAYEVMQKANEADLKALVNEKRAYEADIKAFTEDTSTEPKTEESGFRKKAREARKGVRTTLKLSQLIRTTAREAEKQAHAQIMHLDEYDDDLREAHQMEINEQETKLETQKRLNQQLADEIEENGKSTHEKSKIQKDKSETERIIREGKKYNLPVAHTCFNKIDIPLYPSEEQLRQKLLLAISQVDMAFLIQ